MRGEVSKAFLQAAAASRRLLISQNNGMKNWLICDTATDLSMQTCFCRPRNKSSSQIAAF
jgi:hypothetical protein